MKEKSQVQQLLDPLCRVVLRQQTRVARSGKPGAVHDLRVATRRLQEILEFLRPALPSRARARLNRRARRIRRSLGQIRNADVMLTLVRSMARRLNATERRSVRPLLSHLEGEAEALRRAGRRGRGGLKVPRIDLRIQALNRRLRRSDEFCAVRRGREVLGTRLREMQAALPGARSGEPTSIHELRIAVKRYRYALEIIEQPEIKGARTAIVAARSIQTELGRLHDLDVLIELMQQKAGRTAGRALLPRLRRMRGERARKTIQAIDRFNPAQAVSTLDEALAREVAA